MLIVNYQGLINTNTMLDSYSEGLYLFVLFSIMPIILSQ